MKPAARRTRKPADAEWPWVGPGYEKRLAVDKEICRPVMWALDHKCYLRVLYQTRQEARDRNLYKYGNTGTITKVSVSITEIRKDGAKRGRGK